MSVPDVASAPPPAAAAPASPSRPRVPWRALARAVALVRPRRSRFALAVGLGALAVLTSVALLAVSGYLISRASERPPILSLTVAIVAVRALAIGRALARYAERLASHDLALRILAEVRVRFFAAVAPLVPGGLGPVRRGDVLSRFVADVDRLQDLYLRGLGPPVLALVVVAVVAVATAIVLPAAALVLLVALLVAGAGVPALSVAATRAAALRQGPGRAELSTELVEVVDGAAELAVYGREGDWADRVRAADALLARAQRTDALVAGGAAAAGTLIAGAALVGVAALGVRATADGELDGVLLASLVFVALAAFEAVVALPAAAQQLGACASAAARLEEVADALPPVRDPATPRPLPPAGALVAEDVNVRYGAARPALDGAGIVVAPGARVALVGRSGAGKTTLAHLLVRFRDPDGGHVTFAGIDLRDAAQDEVRARVRLAGQDAHLFTTSVRANVAIGRPGADDAAIRAALGQAGLGPWLAALPRGLDTPVGEEGAQVSGGERGRIALARVLLSDAAQLVLDEPTAHLDPPEARALLGRLGAARDDARGMLVITHTTDGLEGFDEVVVLEAGRVVRRGPPAEVLPGHPVVTPPEPEGRAD